MLNHSKWSRFCLVFTLGLVAVCGVSRPLLAAQESSQTIQSLVQDSRVRSGTLSNGVQYAVMANAEPKGRASLRLLVKAGSFYETEEQRGIAHFLEHMAFNGSKNFPPGSLIEFFQRMGMSFGGDTNASTGFDRTQYQLELADASPANLKEGLKVLSDYAGGLLLKAEEIDKERGIIASEKLSRDSVQFRTMQASMKFAYSGTIIADRMPIGIDEVIKNAPRERFVDFYDTWYRPENIAVILVGDFDATAAESFVKEVFGSMQGRAPAKKRQELGTLDVSAGLKVGVHHEAEATSLTISLSTMSPAHKEPDSVEKRLRDIPAEVAASIVSRRLGILAKKEGAPILNGAAGIDESYDLVRTAGIRVACKPDNWKAALAVADQELRRALSFGFQDDEVKEIVSTIRNSLKRAVVSAPTRRSPDLADGLLDSNFDEQVFTTPEADLALYEPMLSSLTAEQCLAALRKEWAGGNRRLFVAGRLPMAESIAVAQITEAYSSSAATRVEPGEKRKVLSWDYDSFGKPGEVTKRTEVEDLGITLVTFSNGVRLNIKPTTYEAGRIRMMARVGEGSKTEPASKRGLSQVSGGIFDAGGLGHFSIDEMQMLLAGRNVGWRFGPSGNAFLFSGATTKEDLLLQCQLLAAKLTDSALRPEALRQFRKAVEQTYERFPHSPDGPMSLEIANLLANGDPRFGMPDKAAMLSLGNEDVQAWLARQLAEGEIEISVVGDVEVEAVIKAFGETLGALPQRVKSVVPPEMLKVSFPEKPFSRTIYFDSELPKSVASVFWPTTDGMDTPLSRRLTLLSLVLQDRLRVKIREEMGGTYSPSAQSVGSETYPGYGYFMAQIEVSPDMAEKVANAVIAQADDLARNGISDDELQRARKPLLTSVRESSRTNSYWLGTVLARAQSRPVMLDWARTREADVASITKAELNELAARYLGADRASKALIISSQKGSSAETAPSKN